jgi:translation initiation factor 1
LTECEGFTLISPLVFINVLLMAKKKQSRSLSDLGSMVFSTGNEGFQGFDDDTNTEAISPVNQLLEVHIEKKGRGGKTAVIVKGFEGSEEALKDLAKDLKSHCATGGSVKDGEIIIQGDLRPKVMDFLHKKSFKTKRVGG